MSIALILKEVREDLGIDIAAKYDFVFNFIQKMGGGGHLDFNNSVFLSERRSCDRNSALAHFMLENKCLPGGIEIKKIIDLYCQVCKNIFAVIAITRGKSLIELWVATFLPATLNLRLIYFKII